MTTIRANALLSLLVAAIATLQLFRTAANSQTIPTTNKESIASSRPALGPLEVQLVFPGAASQGQAVAKVRPPAGCELVTLHGADGTKIVALFGKSAKVASGPKPVVLFFYGNGTWMAQCLDCVKLFQRLGYNVIVPDYEGYGMSDGKPSEAGCYTAADAVYDYVLTRKDVDSGRIVSVGLSLGGAVAIDLAKRKSVAGLVTFATFTSMTDMCNTLAKTLPVRVTVSFNSQFDSLTKIASVSCPILMFHGSRDQMIPPEMLDRLAAAAKSKVTTMRVPGADHNDVFNRGGNAMWNRFTTFVDGLPKVAPTTRSE